MTGLDDTSVTKSRSRTGRTRTVSVQDASPYVEDVSQLYIPECELSAKPCEGRIFETLQDAEGFYSMYAQSCGFKPRKTTITRANDKDKTIISRYVVCTREGLRAANNVVIAATTTSDNKRMRLSARVECMERIILKRITGGRYTVKTFIEGHTHPMVNKEHRYMMTTNRRVDEVNQTFLLCGIKANIGPMRTFRFFKELVGGYENIRCTSTDYKNFARDLSAFVEGVDAHILLDNFKSKQDECPGFKYFFDVCEENKLTRVFWVDAIAVKNFSLFGDAISFDATYNTNKYNMIFTPFTGKDNHGSCVSLGAALINKEDEESYKWVLEKFVESMGVGPKVLITDQDPALKKAVAAVMTNTTHRYCMWHIVMKLAEKLPHALRQDSDFKKRFDKIIWSDIIEIEKFEDEWHKLMDEFNLNENRWFSDLFQARRFWIPAFFRDTDMSGIFRTTSSSESENSFFKRFLNKSSDLVRFHMYYTSAIEAQRSAFDKHNMDDENGIPDRVTDSSIERHAATIYSIKKFKDVQDEIVASLHDCVVPDMASDGSNKIFHVRDVIDGVLDVYFHTDDDYLSCSYRLFTRKGFLCRNIFYVMKNLQMKRIHDKYIVSRWTKLSMQTIVGSGCQSSSPADILRTSMGGSRFFVALSKCMAIANGNKLLEGRLYSGLDDLSKTLGELCINNVVRNTKETNFERFYGSKKPTKPSVKSPDVCKNKGSGEGGRRKSDFEKAVIASNKPKRKCANCQESGHHDARNCPRKRFGGSNEE